MDLRSKMFLAAAAALGVTVTACGGSHAADTSTGSSSTSGTTATTGAESGASSCGAGQGSGSCGADEGSSTGAAHDSDAGMGDMPMSGSSTTAPH